MGNSQKSAKQRDFEREAIPHMNLLYNFARRLTNSPDDADDLIQETFLKAFRFWDSYERGTNIKAWLFRILRNSYINRYRRENREPEEVDFNAVQHLNLQSGSNGNPQDLGENVMANLLEDDIAEAIVSLPEEFRTVLILCDIEGLAYEEIAEFIDRPIGTVRSRLHRGRKILRTKLLDYAKSKGYATEH
jgi:RNA polymerase sigma-70 factor (ECF subfamily)